MELAILANSPFCKPDTGFMDKVFGVINDCIESNLLKLTLTTVSVIAAVGLIAKTRKVRAKA